MKDSKLNKGATEACRSLEKALFLFVEATRLRVLYGIILTTPAKEIKKMKLRRIKKELKILNAKKKGNK